MTENVMKLGAEQLLNKMKLDEVIAHELQDDFDGKIELAVWFYADVLEQEIRSGRANTGSERAALITKAEKLEAYSKLLTTKLRRELKELRANGDYS